MLLKLLGHVKYLARQALLLRGNCDGRTDTKLNSNFHQLMLLRAEEDPEVIDRLGKKKFMSPQIKN